MGWGWGVVCISLVQPEGFFLSSFLILVMMHNHGNIAFILQLLSILATTMPTTDEVIHVTVEYHLCFPDIELLTSSDSH